MSATSTKQNSKTKPTTSRGQGPREGWVVWAMIQVLDGKRKPMKPAEILEEIQKLGLAKKLSGKTPEASVAARLAVHVGIYFERPEKGKYQLKKGITAKSLSSATGSKPSSKRTTRTPARNGGKDKQPASEARQSDSTVIPPAESTQEPVAAA
jgi:hypothetical protein